MTDSGATVVSQDLIAVTGATGFIGSHLLSHLDAQNIATRALIRAKPRRDLKVPKSTEIISGSLRDTGATTALLKGVKTCIHLAGATSAIDANGFHAANVVGTYDMAAGARAAGVRHFIYVSSQAARAPGISEYAASKAMSEAAIKAFAPHMKITIIRPPAVIGPGDPMLQPVLDLVRSGWLPAPAEPKGETRKFAVISVEDLVTEIVAAVQAGESAAPLIEPCSIPAADWQQIASAAGAVLQRDVRLLRAWPALMRCLGATADGVARLIRRPLPLSGNKVRELLAVDWTYDHPVRDAMDLQEVFVACFEDQRS